MLNMAVFIEGILTPEDALGIDNEKIEQAAYRAINYAADGARAAAAAEIRKQINFPASYLNPSEGRLSVTRKAGPGSLEAIITGRHRATSLARFVTSGTPGKIGVNVKVKKAAGPVQMQRAFLMSLRSGNASIDTAKNLGLAVRVERGKVPDKAYKPVRIADGLFLLYGPSVDQVFKTVRSDVSPEASNKMAAEFLRLLERERKGS